jgi:large subunit ribosomal protein L35
MPKLKTKKGVAKRVRVTKTGKAKIKKSNLCHILTTKSTKDKRQSRAAGYVSDADMDAVKQSMPYSF